MNCITYIVCSLQFMTYIHQRFKCLPSPQPEGTVQTIDHQPERLKSRETTDSHSSKSGAIEGLQVVEHDKESIYQYCGRVYTRKEVNDYRVHFVITKNLDAHRTVSVPLRTLI